MSDTTRPVTYWSNLTDMELIEIFLSTTSDITGIEAECMYSEIYSIVSLRVWKDMMLKKANEDDSIRTARYDEELYFTKEYYMRDVIGFCCCGLHNLPDITMALILMCFVPLESKDDVHDSQVCLVYSRDEFKKNFQTNDNQLSNMFEDFLLHYLDSIEITEHGTSIYGSWISYDGRARVLKEVLTRWYDRGCFEDKEE